MSHHHVMIPANEKIPVSKPYRRKLKQNLPVIAERLYSQLKAKTAVCPPVFMYARTPKVPVMHTHQIGRPRLVQRRKMFGI